MKKKVKVRKPTYALYPVRETRRIWIRNGANPERGILVREWETSVNRWLRIADVEILGLRGALKITRMRKRYESYQQASASGERKGK